MIKMVRNSYGECIGKEKHFYPFCFDLFIAISSLQNLKSVGLLVLHKYFPFVADDKRLELTREIMSPIQLKVNIGKSQVYVNVFALLYLYLV